MMPTEAALPQVTHKAGLTLKAVNLGNAMSPTSRRPSALALGAVNVETLHRAEIKHVMRR